MALIYAQYSDGHHLLGTSDRIGGEFLHDEEKHQLVMIMPTPSSPTRSCFFRDHLASPRQWLLSRYDRILELMRFNDGQQACALLALATLRAPPLEACSWLQALIQTPKREKKTEERTMGHNQLGLSLCSAHSLITSLPQPAQT
ncbi:hypothetical protein Bca52824_057615 [Brassica carinata]|uniref:Uncharacterized protein n=1 Tax=Brassica carinata TaxID=52824 RepID=A0A8X7QQW6_BRACI|nr:hypothetical protein Bca52824_057615 [Brassica carinata]